MPGLELWGSFCGDQGAGQQGPRLASPDIPQCRNGQGAVFVGDQPRLLVALICTPLNKATHGDDAALTLERTAECRALGQRLGADIEHAVFRADLFGP